MLRIFSDWKYNPLLDSWTLIVCFVVSVGVRYKQFEASQVNIYSEWTGTKGAEIWT